MNGPRSRLLLLVPLLTSLACNSARTLSVPDSARSAPGARVSPSVPEEERSRVNPRLSTPESIESGRNVYSNLCTPCHGAKGNGRGPLARSLGIAPPDLRKAREQDSKTDGELFFVLTHGHEGMPGQGERWDENLRWDLVNYIRTLRAGPPREATSGGSTPNR